MSTLRTLKKLLVGETWLLPLGIAALLGAGALLRLTDAPAWHDAGGPLLLVGVVTLLVWSVRRSM